jgi:hypothetical protein
LVISLPKTPYTPYTPYMVLASPTVVLSNEHHLVPK